jgi:hypothetical protein
MRMLVNRKKDRIRQFSISSSEEPMSVSRMTKTKAHTISPVTTLII